MGEEEKRGFWEDFGLDHPISLTAARRALYLCLINNIPVLLISETAQGKTAMTEQLTSAMEIPALEYFSMIGTEPTDLTGIPFFNDDGVTFKHLNDGRIPVGDDESIVTIFLDEANRTEDATINSIFGFLNGQLGPHRIGPNVRIILAANPANSTYLVAGQMTSDPALLRRVVVLPVVRTVTELMTYMRNPGEAFELEEGLPSFEEATNLLRAGGKKLDEEDEEEGLEAVLNEVKKTRPWNRKVIDFLTSFPDCIESMNEADSGRVFATSAGWERISNIEHCLEMLNINRHDVLNAMAIRAIYDGTVGPQIAERYRQFVENPAFSLTPKEILYDFKDGSRADTVLRDLTEAGRDAQIIQLLEGVALFIANEAPDIHKIAPSLSKVMLFLNPHTWSAFSESLAKAIRATPNIPAAYAIKLHVEMQKNPAVMEEIHNKFEERESLRQSDRS